MTKPCPKTGIRDHIIWPQTKFWQHFSIELKQNLKHLMKVSNHLSDYCNKLSCASSMVFVFLGGVKLNELGGPQMDSSSDSQSLTAKLATTILLEYYVIWPQTREILVALTGSIECCYNSKDF
jgi:hypothetical protein